MSELAIGEVVLGDAVTKDCAALQRGALSTRYRIEEVAREDDFEFDPETDELLKKGKDEEDAAAILQWEETGAVEPYSHVDVTWTFRPVQPGALHRDLVVHFGGH